MAKHRPTETLLALVQQALSAAPQGLAPREILGYLAKLGEDISRPTLNRLLALGAEREVWSLQSAGRAVVYTLGKSVPSHLSDTHPMSSSFSTESPALQDNAVTPKANKKSGKSHNIKAEKALKDSKPANLHAQIRSVVWWIADTLRDKTGLQVESYHRLRWP
jgi:hypothetical protein